MGSRLLIIEDDTAIGTGLTQALEGQGYDVVWAPTGRAAIAAANQLSPDLALLDLGLPDMDGVDVCRRLREHPNMVIVMLTARHDEMDVVMGLDAGADDYLTKPFRLAELLARIRAHLRRPAATTEQMRVHVGDLEIDRAARRATMRDRELDLRPKEFDLLALFVAEAGNALTRERIMVEVWDEHWYGSTKTLDMHVSWLRRKLADCGMPPDMITTIRGVGYRLEYRGSKSAEPHSVPG